MDSTAAPAAAAGSLLGASPKDPLVGEDWLTCNFYPVALVAMCFKPRMSSDIFIPASTDTSSVNLGTRTIRHSAPERDRMRRLVMV